MQVIPQVFAALGVFERDALDDLASLLDDCVERMAPDSGPWPGLAADPAFGAIATAAIPSF